MKKYIQKIVDHLLKMDKYGSFNDVDVFFVFGSSYKTAMCDWVYGIRIYTELPFSLRDDLVREFQMDVRKRVEHFFKQSVCATDVVFEKP